MDETPAPAVLSTRRRRLLFRANHRGTRENDILVGGYVTRHIAALTEHELDQLEILLELPDPQVADWLVGREPVPPDASALLVKLCRAAQAAPVCK